MYGIIVAVVIMSEYLWRGTMKRFFFPAVIIMSFVFSGLAFAEVKEPMTAKEWYERYGQVQATSIRKAAASTPGTLWNNGPSNLVNGLSSEAGDIVFGSGGPEGDHGSTIADDFMLAAQSELTEIRVCFFTTMQTAELYIYADNGGMPGPSVTAPIFGGPTTASVVTTTFNDNTSRCPAAFGYPGREFLFNASTTGVTLPTLNAGHYWLAVVGRGSGRAFWTPTSTQGQTDFAFDIDGQQAITSVPTMTEWGMIIFMLLAGLGAVYYLRMRRRAES